MLSRVLTFDFPFALLALVYPLLRHQVSSHLLNCLLKCLPMAFLIAVLLMQQRRSSSKQAASYSYTRNILLGLIFSTVGDAFLVWADVWFDAFLGGIAAFGTAHLFYMTAFGLRPFKFSGAAIVATLQVAAFFILQKQLTQMGPHYLVIVPIYGTLLVSMAWRASADGSCEGKNKPALRKLGGFSFVLSDAVLSLTEVTGIVSERLVSAQMSTVIILASYYLAQYCFTKSALLDGGDHQTGKSRGASRSGKPPTSRGRAVMGSKKKR